MQRQCSARHLGDGAQASHPRQALRLAPEAGLQPKRLLHSPCDRPFPAGSTQCSKPTSLGHPTQPQWEWGHVFPKGSMAPRGTQEPDWGCPLGRSSSCGPSCPMDSHEKLSRRRAAARSHHQFTGCQGKARSPTRDPVHSTTGTGVFWFPSVLNVLVHTSTPKPSSPMRHLLLLPPSLRLSALPVCAKGSSGKIQTSQCQGALTLGGRRQ